MSKPDSNEMAGAYADRRSVAYLSKEWFGEIRRAAYEAGLERAAEIVAEMDQTHFALEEIIPTIRAEKETTND